VKTFDPERDWKTLVSHLPSDFEQLAVEHRLLNLQWPNVKVKSAEMLLRLILLHAGADLPLRQTVAIVAQGGGPNVTQVWLHQKMRRAQPYLAALVERMASEVAREASPELWSGYEMVCLDATTVCGPGAEGTDARIHAVLRLRDMRVSEVHVTDATGGETLRRFTWLPNQLAIVDRGYSNAIGIAYVVEQGADVLVRVNRGALPLYEGDDEDAAVVDPLAWCRSLSGHRVEERTAYVAHGEGRRRHVVRGRLIGVRLPEKEAQEARERVRREHGRGVTLEQLEAAAYVMLFTTVPASRLSASRCMDAYRLRWQIELQWKRWKSLCHFDRLPNYRDDTIRSWLTAKVLLGLLLDRIGSTGLASSPTPLTRQPWKMTAIVWPLIVAALLPVRLARAADILPAIADRLDFLDGEVEVDTRQVAVFRKRLPALKAQPRP
jgi:Transposase DDE domain